MGPFPVMTVMGIELDSLAVVARLPSDKLFDSVMVALKMVYQTRPGMLTKVVWPSRTFLCGMIDLLFCFRTKDHPVWFNREFHLDLQWWVHL